MSKRPYLVNFLAIIADQTLNIRCAMSTSRDQHFQIFENELSNFNPTSPIQSLSLLGSNTYRIKITGLNDQSEKILEKEYESDSFGNFDLKIPLDAKQLSMRSLQIFETAYYPGIDLLVGTRIPIRLSRPRNVVITDFDKTLVETQYSTPSEVYRSLRSPLTRFPSIEPSIAILKKLVDEGYQPFILSASPHFYEKAIRDWLYQNQIFTGNIFLKDYRKVFSLFEGDLTPKDLKAHGFYKLNHLVTILLMTHIPDNLVLLGDGFESDADIYLTLRSVLIEGMDPWTVWNEVKKVQAFTMNTRQNSRFLSKLYQLVAMVKNREDMKMNIQIRCRSGDIEAIKNKDFKIPFLNKQKKHINYYQA